MSRRGPHAEVGVVGAAVLLTDAVQRGPAGHGPRDCGWAATVLQIQGRGLLAAEQSRGEPPADEHPASPASSAPRLVANSGHTACRRPANRPGTRSRCHRDYCTSTRARRSMRAARSLSRAAPAAASRPTSQPRPPLAAVRAAVAAAAAAAAGLGRQFSGVATHSLSSQPLTHARAPV
eukprot:COSAG06_NODE_2255_length_7230_cov_6.918385_5_plen_178_part_00